MAKPPRKPAPKKPKRPTPPRVPRYVPCPLADIRHPGPVARLIRKGPKRWLADCTCRARLFLPSDWTLTCGLTREQILERYPGILILDI